MKTKIALLPLFLAFAWIGGMITFSLSCAGHSVNSSYEIELPNSLQSAEDFVQYGITQIYQTWDFPTAKKAFEYAMELDEGCKKHRK